MSDCVDCESSGPSTAPLAGAPAAIPVPLPNPFDNVTDEELLEMQVALTYGCLRSKASIDKRHKKYVCALQQILDDQADGRGSQKPHFPYPPTSA